MTPRSRFFHENPASRTYVIAILNIVFFPNPVSVPKFRRIPLCGWQSNPYPFNVSRIPHCLLVKFRDPGYTLHVRCQFNSSFFFSWFRKNERTPVMGREWVCIYFFSYCCLGRLGWSRRCWYYYGDQSVISVLGLQNKPYFCVGQERANRETKGLEQRRQPRVKLWQLWKKKGKWKNKLLFILCTTALTLQWRSEK